MAATLTRARQASKASEPKGQHLTKAQLRAKVDRLAELEEASEALRVKAAKKVAKETEELAQLADEGARLRAELLTEATRGLGPEESATIQGTANVVEVGKRRMRTEVVDKALLRDMIEAAQPGAFLEICTFSVTAARDYLTKPQRERVLKETFDGLRSFKLKPRKKAKVK